MTRTVSGRSRSPIVCLLLSVLGRKWLIVGTAVCATLAIASPSTARVVAPPRTVVGTLMNRPPQGLHPLPVGTALPLKDLGDFSFASRTVGYGLASTNDALYPVRTSDGGRSWSVDGPWLWIAAADAPATVESIATAQQVLGTATGQAASAWYQNERVAPPTRTPTFP